MYMLSRPELLILTGILVALLTWLVSRHYYLKQLTQARVRHQEEEFLAQQELQKKQQLAEQLQQDLQNSQQLVEQLKQQKQSLEKDFAVLQNDLKHLAGIEPLLKQERTEKEQLAKDNVQLRTAMEQQKESHKQQLALLEKAKQELSDRFKTLAQEIFEEKSRAFSSQNEEKLGDILKPLKEQIHGFRKRVDEVYDNESRQRAELKNQLDNLKDLNQQLSQEAANLTKALKGDKKAQGTWGELILERVLEQSGLRKGEEYETQAAYRDEDNHLFKPDFIVHLPEGKDIVIDSKVSLVDYENYISTQDEQYLKKHVAATRKHIDTLSKKDYANLKGIRSLDYVLMFMPIEPAFIAAVQYDASLYEYAFSRKIVLVTPTTLLAILKTIESIWRYEKQNRHARKIADSAASVYNKLVGFVADMEKLGTQLSTVHKTYDNAMNKLSSGRGNLISLATGFTELGVKVKKQLPKKLLEDSGSVVDEQTEIGEDNGDD